MTNLQIPALYWRHKWYTGKRILSGDCLDELGAENDETENYVYVIALSIDP
jgi:hypothetical protein